MFYRKIYVILLIAAVVLLMLSSTSFTAVIEDTPGSFAVNTNIEAKSTNEIVKTVANIKVEALIDSVVSHVDEGVQDASKNIYDAKLKQERQKVQESKAASGTFLSASPADLSGIEAEILNLINQTRAGLGLSTLEANQTLVDLARLRSSDMVSRNYFSHYTPDGKNIKNIFAQYGVSYKNFGENLGNATPASYGSPQAFLDAWMNSPSHRDNMLKGYYTLIGVGVIDGGGRRVVTVLFIR